MKDAGSKRSICLAAREDISKMSNGACSAGGNDRNADGFAHCSRQLAIESCARAVRIHGCEQNFAGAALLGLARPLDDTPARRFAAALYEDLRIVHRIRDSGIAPRIDGDNDSLRAEAAANVADQ